MIALPALFRKVKRYGAYAKTVCCISLAICVQLVPRRCMNGEQPVPQFRRSNERLIGVLGVRGLA